MFKYFVLILCCLLIGNVSDAVRLKDIANIRGIRDNQLIGYGIVVGLNGTGDSKLEFTNKSVKRMLDKIGVKVDGDEVASKNVAAVIVTANLRAFARAGNRLSVTVNSLGNAKSLKGGTLLQSPLRASDKNIYAVAQGPIIIGAGDHETVATIPDGAIVEKDMDSDFAHRKMYRFTLNNPDLTTAARIAKTMNMDLGGKYATAIDPSTVDLIVPFSWEGKGVELLAIIESLPVFPDSKAKVVVNEKTGTVVIGEHVKISKVAISHGDLTVVIPAPKPKRGATKVRGPSSVAMDKVEKVHMVDGIDDEVSVGELVQRLNRIGVSPKDLITILQNIKASGALQGELEIL